MKLSEKGKKKVRATLERAGKLPPPKSKPLPTKPPGETPGPPETLGLGKNNFQNPIDLKNSVVFISGKRGSGKTTLGVRLARDFKKSVFFDPRGECAAKMRELKIPFTEARTYEDFVQAVLKSPNSFRVVYFPASIAEEFVGICRYIGETPFEDTLFFVDEVAMNCDTYNIPPEFEHILRFGRHNRVGLIMTAQRPSDVNRAVTAQCSLLFIFHQHEPRDVQYFSGFIGEDARKLQDLKDFSFLLADFGGPAKVFDKNLKPC